MREARVRIGRIVIALVIAAPFYLTGFALTGFAPTSFAVAKEKPKSAPPASAKGKPPPGEAVNACGCYHDSRGGCVCTDKKGKCECPGECEPVGCGEKRDKEMEREMAAEIKRAQEDEKKRKEALEAQENGAPPDAGEPAPEPVKPPTKSAGKPAKPPAKSPRKDAPAKTDDDRN
jgi:hypothetical protein